MKMQGLEQMKTKSPFESVLEYAVDVCVLSTEVAATTEQRVSSLVGCEPTPTAASNTAQPEVLVDRLMECLVKIQTDLHSIRCHINRL